MNQQVSKLVLAIFVEYQTWKFEHKVHQQAMSGTETSYINELYKRRNNVW